MSAPEVGGYSRGTLPKRVNHVVGRRLNTVSRRASFPRRTRCGLLSGKSWFSLALRTARNPWPLIRLLGLTVLPSPLGVIRVAPFGLKQTVLAVKLMVNVTSLGTIQNSRLMVLSMVTVGLTPLLTRLCWLGQKTDL